MKKLAIAAGCFVFAISVSGQDKPDRGYQPANAYSISDIENVNLTNGNLMMHIPLASVPGRGTAPEVSISARYDSKLWNAKSRTETDGTGAPDAGGYNYQRLTLQRMGDDGYSSGGWFIDIGGYRLTSLNRSELDSDAAEPVCNVLGQGVGEYNWGKNAYLFKLEMHMPDGSVKEFRPYGTGVDYDDPYQLGYYSINENGDRLVTTYETRETGGALCTIDWSHPVTTGMNYYSSDGSGTRLFIPHNATDHWTLYIPNGSKVENLPTDDTSLTQRLTDRNGNHIYWKPATLNGNSGSEIVNDVGQYVFLYGDSSGNTVVQQPGVGGNLLSTTLHWTTTYVYRQYQSAGAANANFDRLYDILSDSITNLDTITLPSQLGSRQYTFTYHGTSTDPGTTYTDGFGELKSVTLPSGASAEYSYDLDLSSKVPLSTSTMQVYYANNDGAVVENAVDQRVLTYALEYDGSSSTTSETTKYNNGASGLGTMIGPDGSASTDGAMGSDLRSKSVHPDGSVTEDIWANNIAPKVNANTNIWHVTGTNAFIKTEFTSVPDASGALTYTAIKDFDYDKNGNVLAMREYDWVPYADVARQPAGQPTGVIPSTATLVRQTVNTYYNPTPIATDTTTDDTDIYANPSSQPLHNVIKTTEIQDGSGVPKARIEFHYDNPNTTGNLTQTDTWDDTKGILNSPDSNGFELDTGNSISIQGTYNSYGEPTQTTDANGVETTITYGCIDGNSTCDSTLQNRYPTKTEVASNYSSLKRTTTAIYEVYTGLVTAATDADNNVSTVTTYDDLGRPIKVATAAGTALESWTQTEYHDLDRFVVVKSDIETKGDGRKVATQFFDQLGRVRLAKTLEDASTQSATNETDGVKVQTRYLTDYNSGTGVGHTYQLTSNPYRAATSAAASTEPTMGWTLSTALNTGRHSEVQTFSGSGLPTVFGGSNTSSTGTVNTDIDANATTVTDQASKVRRSVTNALGQLIRVDEPDGNDSLGDVTSPYQPTSYTYDVLNNLLTVTQTSNTALQCGGNSSCTQTRTFAYSSLSRLTSAANPESGTISYVYDPNGNLTRKTDARGVQTDYVYDALNRITNRNYSTPGGTPLNYQASLNVTYTYDNVTNAKGKLTKVSTGMGAGSSTTEYTSFDILGRVTGAKQTTDGTDYNTAYSYKLNGALDEETYPSGRVVKNVLDSNGDLSIVESKKNAAAGYWSYANSFTYNPAGAVTSMQLGNGHWESTVFNSRLQPTQIALGTVPNATDKLKLNYDYGSTSNNGNVQSQTITVPGMTYPLIQNYTYDSLNRLTSATETSNSTQTWKQAFTFDRYGNRNFDQGNTTQPASFADPSVTNPTVNTANNRFASGQGYSYDSSGNTATDANGQSYVYDAENKMVSASTGAGTLGEYFYDGDGKRIKKIVPTTGEETIFVYDAAGKEIVEYSTIVASSADAKVSYLTADHLGSPRISTDANGAVISRHDYMPFGEEIIGVGGRVNGLNYSGDAVQNRFTGQRHDPESTLDYFNTRYYSSVLGRFTSTDPIILSERRVFDPQIWNAYSYAGSNPLRYVDPSGNERIPLGDSEDKIKDDINKKKAEKKQIDQDKTLSKDQKKEKKDEINKQLNTLNKKLEGTRVVNAMLNALDKVGERNGLTLSDFTLSTDRKNDFPGLTASELKQIGNDQAFSIAGDPVYGGTVYIRTDESDGFYQRYLSSSEPSVGMDYLYYGAAALAHEQYHRLHPRDPHPMAFQRQMDVLVKFKNYYQNSVLYNEHIQGVQNGINGNP